MDYALHDLSLEEKADVCKKIQNDWMKGYAYKLLKGKKYCTHCKKYFNKSEFNFVEETQQFLDRELKVEGIFVYNYCPKCNKKTREWKVGRKVIR